MVRNGPRFGARKDEFLPYVLIRYRPGDTGARPFPYPFWESPDIYALPNTDADSAPLMPPPMGFIPSVQIGVSTTLYAHVWNLGRAAAFRVRVEFYSNDAGFVENQFVENKLIGAAWIDLGDRFTHYPEWMVREGPAGRYISRGCHAIVRCPQTWIPAKFDWNLRLLVRAFEPILDATPKDSFWPASDRHVALLGVTTVKAGSPARIDLPVKLRFVAAPVEAKVEVVRVPLAEVTWPLLSGRTSELRDAQSPVIAGLLPPTPSGSRTVELSAIAPDCRQQLLKPRESFHQGCDPLQIQFHASADQLGFGEVAFLRIQHTIGDNIVDGHSVVLFNG